MEFFTGISILCSMKQNWNENIIEKMMQAMKLVIIVNDVNFFRLILGKRA